MWSIRKYGFLAKLFKKSQLSSSDKFKQQLVNVSDKMAILEVFLFLPAFVDKHKQPVDHEQVFNYDLAAIADKTSHIPVFLDQNSALHYSRYLGESYSILRAYVQDKAVAGDTEKLYFAS